MNIRSRIEGSVTLLLVLFVGARQLGLLDSAGEILPVIYCVGLLYYAFIAWGLATFLGDKMVLRLYKYDVNEFGERWQIHGSESFYPAPGRWLRILVHLGFQLPVVFFGTLFLRH